MTNFADMLSKAKAMQDKMKEAQEQIKAAYNNETENLKKISAEELSKVTGGLNLPSDFKLPF